MAERGVSVDHATLDRWVVKFSPLIAANAQARKRPTAGSWRMDETYIKVKGKLTYLYRAVDHEGKTLDFILSERRDTAAARRFLKRAIGTNGTPDRVVIDQSGANLAGLQSVNVILKFTGAGRIIKILQVRYLNNILEQDHRFINRITGPMLGFKAFHSAAAAIAGIETAHMIRKGQFDANGLTAFQQFAALQYNHVQGPATFGFVKSLRHNPRNLLRIEVRSQDVGRAAVALVDGTLSSTTGAQIPVDGGNDRVI